MASASDKAEMLKKAKERWEICKVCPEFKANQIGFEICLACGCNARTKVLPLGEKCPSGRW